MALEEKARERCYLNCWYWSGAGAGAGFTAAVTAHDVQFFVVHGARSENLYAA